MRDSADDFEQQAGKIREHNATLLDRFMRSLESSGLKEKTICKHVDNIDFFLNHYLLYDGLNRAEEGIFQINGFFDWFFPRKAMWSSAAATREYVASLKKFYKFMALAGLVEPVDYVLFLQAIKEALPGWLEHYERENDGY
jgi:hypothetical protein